MRAITGIGASDGLVMGTVRRLRHTQAALGRAVMDPRQEEETYRAAAQRAKQQLEKLEQKAEPEDRAILSAQRTMLDDPDLQKEILSYIRAGAGAAAAVERAAGIYAGRIRALDDDYLRERACDVLDACYRVVGVLDDQPHTTVDLSSPSIIAAEELYPTDILTLDRSMILGIVTGAGSANAHACFIARTMGIPAVVMAGLDFVEQCDGQTVAMDGASGEVYLEPDEATKARFAHQIRLLRRTTLSAERLRETPCRTKDGTRILLLANCATPRDIRAAMAAGADGIGLLSSEYLLLAGEETDEESQLRFYADCLKEAQGKPVTISTYDVGGDKVAPGVPREEERNPALGLVGLRYCLAHPELFQTQLRALLRAGLAGPLRIAIPMVSTRQELELALDAVYQAKASLRARGTPFAENVPVGVIIETPAAALTAEDLAQHAGFFAVNTANLAQYAHAADRTSAQAQPYFPSESPAVHKLLQMAVNAARAAQRDVCAVCINAAAQHQAENYVRLGVRALSAPAGSLLALKESLAGVKL